MEQIKLKKPKELLQLSALLKEDTALEPSAIDFGVSNMVKHKKEIHKRGD